MGRGDRAAGLTVAAARTAPPDDFDERLALVEALVQRLWDAPELGYHETGTAAAVIEWVTRLAPGAVVERFARTGVSVRLPSRAAEAAPDADRPLTVAVVAELDALIVPAHPDADPVTGAVHACGHHTQVGIACSLFAHYAAGHHLPYDLVFVWVPAEEYVDLDRRRALRDAGEIAWFGGKPEAMSQGVFDDIDAAVLVHAMGGGYDVPTVELNCDLAGFLYKHVTFRGSASHAGFDPFSGVNAASMATLYSAAIGLGRQQLREDVYARLNPVVTSPPMTTNIIPDACRVSTDVRTIDLEYMGEMSRRLDAMAAGSALALGGRAEIETEVGYLPFHQHRGMSQAWREAYESGVPGVVALLDDRGAAAAAGDVGDLSYVLPCVQLGYSGFTGTVHGRDFRLSDDPFVLAAFPRFVAAGLERLGDHLDGWYRRSFEEYELEIERIAAASAQ